MERPPFTPPDLAQAPPPPPAPRKLWLHIVLFGLTVLSVFHAGTFWLGEPAPLWKGWTFGVPLLAILVCHEFGHYFFARRHRVDASLPYFIPVPWAFGTLGAIIKMRGRIPTRNALLDIGSAGPIAGIVVAIPVLCIGLSLSEVAPIRPGGLLEGQALLYLLLKRIVVGPIPDGYDVYLHPTALAGWVGLFITMLNLLPVGQLDGGHIAYALFGEKQNRYSRWAHLLLFPLGVVVGIWSFASHVLAGEALLVALPRLSEGLNWIVFGGVLFVLRAIGGANHPPTGPEPLGPVRRVVGWACLALFASLFMPVFLSQT